MKKIKIWYVLCLWMFAMNAQGETEITTDKQRLSYALGFVFAKNIAQQAEDVDVSLFIQAIQDVLNKQDIKLSEQEMEKILIGYQQEIQKQQAEKAMTNKQQGESFLAQNKSAEGVTELPSGLQYKVIRAAEGPKPTKDSTVVVHYRGTLLDGTEFDNSYTRGTPAEFPVGGVIQGWQEAIMLMSKGAKWQIFIPADLAYGEQGAGGTIGPNATLSFDVELIDIK